MGRPTDFSPDLADIICERIAEGESLRKICRDEAMPNQATVHRWLIRSDHPEFREQYRAAREAQADSLVDQIMEIADDSANDIKVIETDSGTIETVNHEHIQRSRLRVTARQWAAARMAPKKYGERVVNEISGPDGGPIPVAHSITLAQVEDDLSSIFGVAAQAVAAAPAAPEPAADDPVVHPGPDGGSGEEPGAPAPGAPAAGEERPVFLADDDL